MAVQIGAQPDSGFDDPIGMLTDCHRRIERFLAILVLVVERASARALTNEESEAVQAALDYFRTGGRRHNADEEESLFPRLRAAINDPGLEQIVGLESEHREASQLQEAVEKIYEMWIERGALEPPDHEELLRATHRLKRLYEEHIRIEEQVVFPRAAELLNQESIKEIGKEFRVRRA